MSYEVQRKLSNIWQVYELRPEREAGSSMRWINERVQKGLAVPAGEQYEAKRMRLGDITLKNTPQFKIQIQTDVYFSLRCCLPIQFRNQAQLRYLGNSSKTVLSCLQWLQNRSKRNGRRVR